MRVITPPQIVKSSLQSMGRTPLLQPAKVTSFAVSLRKPTGPPDIGWVPSLKSDGSFIDIGWVRSGGSLTLHRQLMAFKESHLITRRGDAKEDGRH
jgi:hypothetical protein